MKKALLVSSSNSRIISTPALISLNENKNVPEDEKFKRNAIPVAMLLEGKFTRIGTFDEVFDTDDEQIKSFYNYNFTQ